MFSIVQKSVIRKGGLLKWEIYLLQYTLTRKITGKGNIYF